MVTASKDYIVTESKIDPLASGSAILAFLRSMKTTGAVTFNLVQGGIATVVVVEKTPLTENQSVAARDIAKLVSKP